jgi:hypothetical protein
MTAASTATYGALLREIWPQTDIFDELYTINQSYFGVVNKDTTFYEYIRHIAVGYGYTGGASAQFTNAKRNKSPSVESKFDITPVIYYSLFSIQRNLLRRAQNKKAAILPALERQVKMALNVWKRRQGIYLWGSGVGNVAQILTDQGGTATLNVPSGTTQVLTSSQIQITNVPDMKKFQKNVNVGFMTGNTVTDTQRTQVVPLLVTNLDRDNGILTFNVPVNTSCPTHGATDYICFDGDANGVAAGNYGWVPQTAPTSTAWFGLDRTQDVQWLGGWRVSGKGMTLKGAAMKAAKVIAEADGQGTHLFLSPNDYLNLQYELESSGNLRNTKDPASSIGKYSSGVTFNGIEFMGSMGPIKAFFDINVPDGYPMLQDLDTWTFATMGDAPYFDSEDGNEILREVDADAFEGRIVGDLQNYTEAPGRNVVLTLNS